MKKFGSNVVSMGFTLIELVAVLAVISVLLASALPSFGRLVESARQRGLGNDLLNDLRLTRSEAILRGVRVVMCVAASSESCATSGGWQQGWLLFVDSDNSGTREAGEPVLRFRSAAPAGWSISGNGPVARYVSYDALGTTRLTGGAFQAGTVTVCRIGTSNTKVGRVIINSLGRPRIQEANMARCG